MILQMSADIADGYKSRCQIARRITEHWGADNLYCASCSSETLEPEPCNTKAVDFRCPSCEAGYQLKAGMRWSEHRVPDAAYSAMLASVRSDSVPNLLVMQYTPQWHVHNLMLVPSFVFNESAVEARKPLAPTARRAGWIGCNILLDAIPANGKLRIVEGGMTVNANAVRTAYEHLRPLAKLPPKLRGWTLDVLRVVQNLGSRTFSLTDVYRFDSQLPKLHPDNRHVRPKIRQQLQVLRDAGLIRFLGDGQYTLTE